MNRRRFFVAALPATLYAAQPLTDDPKQTGGQSNGRFWVGLSLDAKFALPESLNLGEISESLDQFYAEPTNRVLPVDSALMWVDLKAKGVSDAGLKEWESTTRAAFATKAR